MVKSWLRPGMTLLLLLGIGFAHAEVSTDDCALARDPARCEARQKALASCADMHGTYKRACLEAALPKVDCGRAKNPASCETAQKAREAAKAACQGKEGPELRQCLYEQKPKKKSAKKGKRSKAKAKKAKKT